MCVMSMCPIENWVGLDAIGRLKLMKQRQNHSMEQQQNKKLDKEINSLWENLIIQFFFCLSEAKQSQNKTRKW